MSRPGFLHAFMRSQISALLATGVDFGLLFGFVEVLHVWYVIATALGAAAGAVTNFILNREWSFKARNGHLTHQARRYLLVSAISLLLNTAGVYVLTEFGRLPYGYSVIFVSSFVGVFFNFPLHRHWVFHVK